MAGRLVALALLSLFAACKATLPDGAECWSLDGRALSPPTLPGDVRADREAKLAAARAELAANPDDKEAWIWVGRRLGYLSRFREAIDVYTQALEKWPLDPFLLRHRGHRWISLREFNKAARDLHYAADRCHVVADEVEPDGLPVPGRPPHSSLHFNVHYHFGLAFFLLGVHEGAEHSWRNCLAVSNNDESRVAVTHWLWCSRMRCGDREGAAEAVANIAADMDIVENTAYHQLCLLYAGKLSREQIEAGEGSSGAALRFGLAHYDLVTGNEEAAYRQFEALAASPGWAAFGVIAAEAELNDRR